MIMHAGCRVMHYNGAGSRVVYHYGRGAAVCNVHGSRCMVMNHLWLVMHNLRPVVYLWLVLGNYFVVICHVMSVISFLHFYILAVASSVGGATLNAGAVVISVLLCHHLSRHKH